MAEVDKYYEARRLLDGFGCPPDERNVIDRCMNATCPECGVETTVRCWIAVGTWICTECYSKKK